MNWWRRLTKRGQAEAQLEKELLYHLDLHAANLIASGTHPDEARRQARLALGGPEQVKEKCRDARGTRWLEDFWHDIRYAVRALRQRPGFAAVALSTLALGVGATTVMFSLVDGVLLKPLSYPEPARLLGIEEQTNWSTQWGNTWAFSYPNYLDARDAARSLDIAAWRYNGGTITNSAKPEYVDAFEVSSNLFRVLGVSLLQGRAFRPDEDLPGAQPVAIISYALWQRRYAGNLSALGTALTFEGKPYTIVGIARPRFHIGDDDGDVYTPIGQETRAFMSNRESHPGIAGVARLQPGATFARAQTELSIIAQRLEEQFPKSNRGRAFTARRFHIDVSQVQSTLWLLLGAVALVLLIACANIAGLLLARAVSRERELAMRVALGASRGRVIRQCLTESGVLGLLGGALGVLLAAAATHPFIVFWPGDLPRAEEITLDWRVLLFALATSLLCGVLFGIAPALRAPARQLEVTLRAGARNVIRGRSPLHSAFVVAEIALALVLLVSAGMLGRTLLHLSSLNPGVNVRNILTSRMALSPSTLEQPGRTRAAWQDILDRARRVPGVDSVTLVDTVPMREGNNQIGYWTTPAEPPPDRQPLVLATSVTPDYLRVMGIALRKGRFFTDRDVMGNESVAVIDEVMAQRAFPSQDPIGKHVWIGLGVDPRRVIGVVAHVRYWGPAADDTAQVRSQLYYPFAQVPDNSVRRWSELMSIAVRTNVPPLSLAEPLRRQLRGATGDQVLYETHTMEQLVAAKLSRQRFLLLLFGIFASLALLLASIGIYGILAYLTSQRVPEIGVRVALGAGRGQVLWLVLRQSLAMVLAGAGIGIVVASAAARALTRLVEGMQPAQAVTFAAVLPVLIGAALIASFLPARRASRIDPMIALRQE